MPGREELLIMLFLALCGSFARLIYKVAYPDKGKPVSYIVMLAQIVTSLFAGVLVWMFSVHYKIALTLKAPIVLMASYWGHELVEWGHDFMIAGIKKEIKRRFKIGRDSGRHIDD